ncbi:hypothetical protein N7501_001238 [Penicillium viridicatum]|nr:hypothetical protein N7501_001238 [Penicillium viridicatum]
MGFTDLLSDSGLTVLNSWLATRSYIVGYVPADVVIFKTLSAAPEVAKYPHATRWYKHIVRYNDDFATFPGDVAKPYTVYGPGVVAATLNPAKAPAAEEDDDVSLFGSDDEKADAEAARVREEHDETDMAALEAAVRGIEKVGLVWGTSKFVPIGFGIKKLQINLVIEDEKVSLSDLEEEIQEFEDYVQSTDIATMNKL